MTVGRAGGPSTASPGVTAWHFDVNDVRTVEGWLEALPGDRAPSVETEVTTATVDTYMDTEDWRLYRAGYSLRLRHTNGGFVATLKSLAEDADRLRRRTDFEETVAGADAGALLYGTGPVGTRLRLAAGRMPLVPLFDIRTRRRAYRLVIDGKRAGEIAVDRTTIEFSDERAPIPVGRVAVEVLEPLIPAVAPLVESMRSASGLQPTALSKYQAGLMAGGLRPSLAPDLGPIQIDPTMAIGEVAFAVLRRHTSGLLAHEPGTRIGDDSEDLHDMRVAARRLRAALSLFEEALPVSLVHLRQELEWMADALGVVRDLDIQLEQIDAWATGAAQEDAIALESVRGLLEEQRLEARERMLDVLDSARYDRVVTRLTAALRRGPLRAPKASRVPVLVAAPDMILDRYRAIRKAGRRIGHTSTSVAYHRLRIKTKRLRYALEFLSDVYPRETPPLVRRLAALQDILGLHQDADIAVRWLRSTVAERGASLAPATIFAMGVVARHYGEHQEELRTRSLKAHARVVGKRWKALQQEMLRRRPPAPPKLRPVESIRSGTSIAASGRTADRLHAR